MDKKKIQKINNLAITTLSAMILFSTSYASITKYTNKRRSMVATVMSLCSTVLLAGYVKNKENFR